MANRFLPSKRFFLLLALVMAAALATPIVANFFAYLASIAINNQLSLDAFLLFKSHLLVSLSAFSFSISFLIFMVLAINYWRVRHSAPTAEVIASLKYSALISDSPIMEAKDDKLGLAEYVKQNVANFIVAPKRPSIVFGFIDPWGAGKTSTINLLLEQFKLRVDAPLIVDFNPWFYTRPEHIVDAFVNTFFSRIKQVVKGSSSLSIDHIQYRLRQALLLIDDSKIQEALDLIYFISSQNSQRDSMDEIRERMQNVIDTVGRPVIVVVDDMDRLDTPGLIATLMSVRLLGNFDGVAYLLAMDHDSVCKRLKAYGGREFLSKIIQKQVSLPKPPAYRFIKLADSLITDHFGQYGLQLRSNAVKQILDDVAVELNNPRKLKRLLNDVLFFAIAHGKDFAMIDIILMSVLHTCALQVYQAIEKAPRAFASRFAGFKEEQMSFWVAVASQEEGAEKIKQETLRQYVDLASPAYRLIVQRSLKLLFPEKFCTRAELDEYLVDDSPARLYNFNNLLGFLSYQDLEVVFLGSEAESFLFEAKNRKVLITAFEKDGRIAAFLEFVTFWGNKHVPSPSQIIEEPFELITLLSKTERDVATRFQTYILDDCSFIIQLVFKILKDPRINERLLVHLCTRTNNFSLSYRVLTNLARIVGLFKLNAESDPKDLNPALYEEYKISPVLLRKTTRLWVKAVSETYLEREDLFEIESSPIFLLFGIGHFSNDWKLSQRILEKQFKLRTTMDTRNSIRQLERAYEGIVLDGLNHIISKRVATKFKRAMLNTEFADSLDKVKPGFSSEFNAEILKVMER